MARSVALQGTTLVTLSEGLGSVCSAVCSLGDVQEMRETALSTRSCTLLLFAYFPHHPLSQISKLHRIAPNIYLALNSSCSDQTLKFLRCVLKKDKSLPQLKPSTFLPSHRIGGHKAPRPDEETSGLSVCSVLFLVFISCSSCCYFRCKAERKPYLLIQR